MVSLAVEKFGWDVGYAAVVGIPLVIAGFLYLFLTPVRSGLEVEEIEALLREEN